MSETDLILVIDQGTTGTKVIAFDQNGEMKGRGYAKLPLQYPKSGWVEVAPDDVALSLERAIQACLKEINVNHVVCIGITNQRETCTVYDIKHQKALYPFIVWQDRRTSDYCEKLSPTIIAQKTGLRAHPYFSASKLNWILHTQSCDVGGDYRVMTIDTFLIYLLSGAQSLVTDPTNASRTLLYNIHENQWDDELCGMFDVPKAALPDVIPNGQVASHTSELWGLPKGIPILSPIGDQQAAWVGSGALFSPTLKLTLGTGAFSIGPASDTPYEKGILQTIGYHSATTKKFGYEGVAFCAGMVTEWLLNAGWISGYDEIDKLPFPAESAMDFFPLFAQMGTPYWKGSTLGASATRLNVQCSPRAIIIAAIQSIAFQNKLILEQYDLTSVSQIYMDGGVSQYRVLQNMMSILLDKEIYVSSFADMTGVGVCVSALKEYFDVTETCLKEKCATQFQPIQHANRKESAVASLQKRYHTWKDNLEALLSI